MIPYSFGSTPFSYQYEAFQMSAEREFFALAMEQGTGKTKVAIDTACHLYCTGKIEAVIVIAPNGVHRDWVRYQFPDHAPDYIDWRGAAFACSMKAAEKKAFNHVTGAGCHLRVFTFNVESLSVTRAVDEMRKILQYHKTMLVVDESSRIKTHDSSRTKHLLKLARLAKYRRILNGTPATEGPLDLFAQYLFLSEDIWRSNSFPAYRARYAELMPDWHPIRRKIASETGIPASRLPPMVDIDDNGDKKFKNLDEIKDLIAPHTFRVLKKDCLDLPDKIYKTRSVVMGAEQQKVYTDLVRRLKEGPVQDANIKTTIGKMNAVMYLQRIVSGILPSKVSGESSDRLIVPWNKNTRVLSVLDELEGFSGKAIFWCRFTADIHLLSSALSSTYGEYSVVTYHGETSRDDRDDGCLRFQNDSAVRWFIGNSEAGGTGLNLFAATQVHYFSNSFKLITRLQSEDRAHRIGQKSGVLYVDYDAAPVDRKLLDALVLKKKLADVLTGDNFEEWINI